MGIQIIPNWHPLFVHFTIAFISVGCVLYCFAAWRGRLHGTLLRETFIVARWSLVIGALSLVFTVIAGFHAFNTVAHDGPSHLAMLDHRNWALVTSGLLAVLLATSLYFKLYLAPSRMISLLAIALLCSLSVTAFKGGELVFRHGLGVMSLPDKSHDHHGEMGRPEDKKIENNKESDHKNDGHGHDHGDHDH